MESLMNCRMPNINARHLCLRKESALRFIETQGILPYPVMSSLSDRVTQATCQTRLLRPICLCSYKPHALKVFMWLYYLLDACCTSLKIAGSCRQLLLLLPVILCFLLLSFQHLSLLSALL